LTNLDFPVFVTNCAGDIAGKLAMGPISVSL
jgi:hypothetical protein